MVGVLLLALILWLAFIRPARENGAVRQPGTRGVVAQSPAASEPPAPAEPVPDRRSLQVASEVLLASEPVPPEAYGEDDLSGPLNWSSLPALGPASGRARGERYSGTLELFADTCGGMSPTTDTQFETALIDGALIIQFHETNAGWSCETSDVGAFECPTLEEAKTESEGKTPHLERAARGVWRVDGSIEFQAQTRTWCEGPGCADEEPCHWSFLGVMEVSM